MRRTTRWLRVASGEFHLKPRCTVIVLNYNGEKLLPACLDSLALQTGEPIDTMIVDNGSTDGSAALVAEHYPWVRFLALNKNYGFTGANNAGPSRRSRERQ